MKRLPTILRRFAWLAGVLGLLVPGQAGQADDSVLFSTTVAPNVLLIADNSGSMEHIVWHPEFDPTDETGWCAESISTDFISADDDDTYCGVTRTLYHDPALDETRWDGDYQRWYFGLDAGDPDDAQILSEIAATGNGTLSECVGGGTFDKYRRSRATALQQVLREVICQVNRVGTVRFGLAQFRDEGDPEGGFVVVPVDDWSDAQDDALEAAIDDLNPETWTPLGETLFQVYTYFMSRNSSDMPLGKDGSTAFPVYRYSTDPDSASGVGGDVTNDPPPSPVEYECQKNFVIVITDGEPTKDDFDTDSSPGTDDGFDVFASNLIGDYNDDGEVEDPDCCDERGLYLDDIAKFMQENDFRPDMDDDPDIQNIDVYTVGFTTTPFANALLEETARVGNGEFFYSTNAEELAEAIVGAISSIIQKAQAFTSATVPATRTAQGGNFYSSFFIPSSKDPFWEGHIRNFTINAQGQILDAGTPPSCALDDPSGNCLTGPFLASAVPHWDAAEEMPVPASRNLTVSQGGSEVDFTATDADNAAALGVTYPPALPYAGSDATDAEELADEIVDYLRGCEFGTRIGSDCQERQHQDGRKRTLGDVFHSDPVVVGPPNTAINEASYRAFATTRTGADGEILGLRQRLLIAGANDGFAHGFDAGSYSSGSYSRGTGEEEFGFMPWWVRTQIKNLPIDVGSRDYYFVDGSPSVADVWLYPSATAANLDDSGSTKAANGSEWATVLVGGLRQGGPVYYALDVTDPSSNDYPDYMWEFPAEGDATLVDATGAYSYTYLDYMGETWSDPVIARVKVEVPGSSGTYERWVAIFGAGYDPSGDPNHAAYDGTSDASTSRAGRGLFMVDVKTGRVLAAHFYHHNDTDADMGHDNGGVGHSDMQYAFASTPAVVDSDFDGFADLVYIGDLGGNLWKWVIRDPGTDTINPSEQVNKAQANWTFGRMFTAPTATIGGNTYYKSFFFAPALTYYGSELWIALGTGERANPTFVGADASDDSENNRFYALKDPNVYGLPDLDANGSPDVIAESDLTNLTTTEGCASVGNLGYYLVAREGEKFVTEVEIIGYYVFAGSFLPNASASPCDSGGDAALYIFRVYCGEGFFPDESGADERRVSLGEGMPTSPRLSLGEENRVYIMTSENELKTPPTPPLPDPGAGIMYWRETP